MSIGSEIQIADIEVELARLGDLQKEKNQIKAALFSLVVYAQDQAHAETLNQLVLNVIEKLPCRIIFIQKHETQADYLRVSVSNQSAEASESTVVCDRILVETSDQYLARISFIILPHILPDLPVYLIWGKDPSQEKEILPHLKPFATKIIFSSDYSHGFRQFSRNILSFGKDSSVELMDINWALLTSWRDVMSKIFDSAATVQRLQSCDSLSMHYSIDKKTNQSPEIQIVYLFCWLAGQLGWKYQSHEKNQYGHQLVYTYASKPIKITLLARLNDQLPQGSVLNIDITCADHYLYSIARVLNSTKVVIHISSLETCEIPVTLPLPCLRRGFTFMKELFYFGTTKHYQSMLEELSQVDW